MLSKYILNPEMQEKVFQGVQKINEVVSTSLGPRGKTVIVSPKGNRPFLTKDGYAITRLFSLEEPWENLGAQIAKEVSKRSAEICGDGSTSTLLLLNKILQLSKKYLISGICVNDIKNGIEKVTKFVIEEIRSNSKKVSSKEDIFNIATISANNDISIGNLVADAIDSVGKDGSILIEENKSFETILNLVEGFVLDVGYVSSEFITNPKRLSINYNDPLFFISDFKISSVQEMLPLLEVVARDSRPLIMMADEIEGQALAALIANAIKGTLKVCVVKPPRYGIERRNIMQDLAIVTGANFISRESGIQLKNVKLTDLGLAKSIEVLKNSLTIIDGNGKQEKIVERMEMLKEEIRQNDNIEECKRTQERITRLSSGVAIIMVGGNSQVEMIEKKFRIEDAVMACKSAIESGIVEGGGITFMKIAKSEKLKQFIKDNTSNEGEMFGMKIVQEAIQEQFNKVVLNAGKNPELIESKCKFEESIGYDANKDKFVNMFSAGIIDATKVVCYALQHATSIAISLIGSEAAIIEI